MAVRVADVADDVAGMLLGDLRAERRPLLPRRRNLVAELVHQLLVDVEHLLGEVVLQADEAAVDGALRERRRGPALEEGRREDALQVHGEVERLLAHPDRVVRLLGEDDVRPALAGAVPQLDLRLHRRRAVAVAVVGDDLDLHVRVRLGVQLRHRQADGVDPDGDRAGRPARGPHHRPWRDSAAAVAATATSGASASHRRLIFMWLLPPRVIGIRLTSCCRRRQRGARGRSPASAMPGSVGAWTRPSGPTRGSRITGLDVTSDS